MKQPEKELLNQGIRTLKTIGLETVGREPVQDAFADYKLEIRPRKGRKPLSYYVTIRNNLNNATLSQWLLDQRSNARIPRRIAILTKYVSPALGNKLRDMEASYFDAAGNAYFNDSEFFVYVDGKKSKEQSKKHSSPFRPAGIKLLMYLLSEPGLEASDYREIADRTGIPKSTVGELISDLERLRFLKTQKNQRRLINKPELFNRWVEAFTESYRPKLIRGRFRTPERHVGRLQKEAIIQYHACWGGEVAAQQLVGHIKPEEVTIYADSLMPQLQAKFGLRRDPQGDVTILRKFWNDRPDQIAPPLVVYADLISTNDTRDLETAQMIYERYLDRLIQTAPE